MSSRPYFMPLETNSGPMVTQFSERVICDWQQLNDIVFGGNSYEHIPLTNRGYWESLTPEERQEMYEDAVKMLKRAGNFE